MRSVLRAVAAALVLAAVVSGCSGGEGVPAGKPGAEVTLATGTCWTKRFLGADPQEVLKLARAQGVTYFEAANATATRPAFARTQDCDRAHDIEVYRAVEVPEVAGRITSYADLLRTDQALYADLDKAVRAACQTKRLAGAAALSKLPGATMEPVFGHAAHLGWAPPSPDQFAKGQRAFACTLTHDRPSKIRYADVFTRDYPTAARVCINSEALRFVDCARKHDREKIAVIQAGPAVRSGLFPGRKAIKRGIDGRRYLDIRPAAYVALDKACTRYLRTISTVKKLSGIAEIDPDFWPAVDGSYPIACEADTRPEQKQIVRSGSVFNK